MHTYSNSKAFEIFSKKNNLLILPREYTPGVFTNYYLLQHKFLENYAKNSLNFDNLRITSLLNDFDRQSLTIKPSLYFFFHVGQEDPVYKETLGGGSPIIRFSSLICSTQDDLYIATSCYSYKEFLNNYLSQSFCNLKNKYVHNFSSKSQTYLFKKQHTASFYTFFYK